MLKVDHLQVFYGNSQALWDVSFEVPKGEIVALIGSNGVGKTTTLKTISGLIKAKSGTITLDGKNIENSSSMENVKNVEKDMKKNTMKIMIMKIGAMNL